MKEYKFEKKDVLWCQLENWYPIFKRFCPKTEFFQLDKNALNYLKSDGSIILPEEEAVPVPQPDIFGQIDSDDAFSDWSTDEEAEPVPHINPVPDLCRKIRRVIGERARKAVVPKLNWSCPSDALHFSPDASLKCMSPNEVFLLLKSSDKINHDLTYPFENCHDSDSTDESPVYTVALQEFAKLAPSREFRCFIRNKQPIAICSRSTTFSDDEEDFFDEVYEALLEFLDLQIIPKVELSSFVVDVYKKEAEGFLIFGFSPFGLPTWSMYFSWKELYDEDFGVEEPVYRFNEGEQVIGLSQDNRVPLDAIHISQGLDSQKLVDYMKLVKEGNLDGEGLQF